MKKTLALSAVLAISALGMACGGGANSNTTNTANGNKMTNVATNANQAATNANMKAENANAMAENKPANGNTMSNNGNMMNSNGKMNTNK